MSPVQNLCELCGLNQLTTEFTKENHKGHKKGFIINVLKFYQLRFKQTDK